jgi:hypothetical protein
MIQRCYGSDKLFKGADLVGNLARNTVTSIKVMQC